MSEAPEVRAALAALDAADTELTPEERERRRRASDARRARIEAAGGTYRAALRRADVSDSVKRR